MLCPFSRTLGDLLAENAIVRKDNLAVISADRQVTFGELHAKASGVAHRLRAEGVSRGDRIGLLVSNRVEWLEISFGALMLGAVIVPFSTWSTKAELAFLIKDSKIKILFSLVTFGERDFLPDLRDAVTNGLTAILVGAEERTEFARYEDLPHAADLTVPPGEGPSAGDDALVLYTSGSTSIPKAVRLKHYGIIENAFNIGERQGLLQTDRVFLSAPLFWAYGGCNALAATFTHGACLVLQEKFEAGEAINLIEKHQCSAIYTLPAMTTALLHHAHFAPERTASLRTGLTIGSEEEFLRTAEKLGVPQLCNIYGSTETYGNCAVTWHYWPLDKRARSQGEPLPGQKIRIRDIDTGSILPSNNQGLIEVLGYVTPGYAGESQALNSGLFTEDGFYITGDVGCLNDEGVLVFSGRNTEMIKRAGINVSPAEIESALLRLDQVSEAAVVGIPDDNQGECIIAFVVPDSFADPPNINTLFDQLRIQLSKYKIPDLVKFCEKLPLKATGKLDRNQLKEDATILISG